MPSPPKTLLLKCTVDGDSYTLTCFFHWQAFLSISLSAILLRLTLTHQKRINPLNLRILVDVVLLSPLIFMRL
jgi:hypothetical protein